MSCAGVELFWIYFLSRCFATPVSSVYETPFSLPSSIHPARLQGSASALNDASKIQNRQKMCKDTLGSNTIKISGLLQIHTRTSVSHLCTP